MSPPWPQKIERGLLSHDLFTQNPKALLPQIKEPKPGLKKPERQEFAIKVRRTASVEDEITVKALDRSEAERLALERAKHKPFAARQRFGAKKWQHCALVHEVKDFAQSRLIAGCWEAQQICRIEMLLSLTQFDLCRRVNLFTLLSCNF